MKPVLGSEVDESKGFYQQVFGMIMTCGKSAENQPEVNQVSVGLLPTLHVLTHKHLRMLSRGPNGHFNFPLKQQFMVPLRVNAMNHPCRFGPQYTGLQLEKYPKGIMVLLFGIKLPFLRVVTSVVCCLPCVTAPMAFLGSMAFLGCPPWLRGSMRPTENL